jgi:pyruvate/2-oxoglutarate dehydrogenase complex dihydrolipoamide dehydrogenase (E3) component
VAASRDGLAAALENAANIALYRGHARFVSPQAVEIAGDRLRVARIFINVGGRALVPPMRGINEVSYQTNSSMMDVDFLPRHLIIVGDLDKAGVRCDERGRIVVDDRLQTMAPAIAKMPPLNVISEAGKAGGIVAAPPGCA